MPEEVSIVEKQGSQIHLQQLKSLIGFMCTETFIFNALP